MGLTAGIHQFLGLKVRQEDVCALLTELRAKPRVLGAFGVFDGVSTTEDGDFAARIAARTYESQILRDGFSKPGLDILARVRSAVEAANKQVNIFRQLPKYAALKEASRPAAVGTVAVVDATGQFVVGSAGDTLAFVRSGGQLYRITEIHNEANDSNNDGKGATGSAVTRFFGQSKLTVHYSRGVLEPETEALWLMTDGAAEPLLRSGFEGDPIDYFSSACEEEFSDNATALHIQLNPVCRKVHTPNASRSEAGAVKPSEVDVTARGNV